MEDAHRRGLSCLPAYFSFPSRLFLQRVNVDPLHSCSMLPMLHHAGILKIQTSLSLSSFSSHLLKSVAFKVKQQKKSSNRWVCVICNEMQSVRKVFARGFLAKDVRKFVQAFNSSRQFNSETPSIPFPTPPNQEIPTEESSQSRKRRDWTEYLEPSKEEEGGGEGIG